MRFAKMYVLAFLPLLLAFPVLPQQISTSTAQSSPQALTLLQQSLAALTDGQPITDVTLSGTARRIAGSGSDDKSGSVVLKALAGTGVRLDLSLPSGPRSEVFNTSAPPPVGSWSGPDGVVHPISEHNLVTDAGWFPLFTLAKFVASQNAALAYIGVETRNGNSVLHISACQLFPGIKTTVAAQLQRLSQTEIFLDPSKLLPVAISLNTHPDNNSSVDIPVEFDFSDYRSVNGTSIPFHIQKYLNGGLLLDLQFQSATINSGLSPATFAVTVQAGF